MSLLPSDINDDEIRIISSGRNFSEMRIEKPDDHQEEKNKKMPEKSNQPPERPKWKIWVIVSAILFFGALCVFFWWEIKDDPEEYLPDQETVEQPVENLGNKVELPLEEQKGYVTTRDTVVGNIPLSIFTPKNSVPKLHVGTDALKDSTAIFVVQAADIRRDNGQIVGAYVSDGNLLSKGQSKAGFCAIINGKITIGVADATPYLEQAIETGGYFFRQYPLVVGGQAVDNKLKSSSLRKALADFNGETVVVMSGKEQTLNDFSRTLVDLGVSNAIYLVGSTAPGFAIGKNGTKIEFGKPYDQPSINSNYIIWQ